MRAALVLVLLIGCAKQPTRSAEPAAQDTLAAVPTAPALKAPPPPPPTEGAKGGGANESASANAKDQARSSGVLGPTEQQAFRASGKVTIGAKTTPALATVVKPALDKLQACYDKALEFQDSLAGELTITVKGSKPTVAKSTLKHAELEQCVTAALAGLTLPAGKSTLVLAFARE
jgi:hypothetical protein